MYPLLVHAVWGHDRSRREAHAQEILKQRCTVTSNLMNHCSNMPTVYSVCSSREISCSYDAHKFLNFPVVRQPLIIAALDIFFTD